MNVFQTRSPTPHNRTHTLCHVLLIIGCLMFNAILPLSHTMNVLQTSSRTHHIRTQYFVYFDRTMKQFTNLTVC